jgi:hypothetical protein
MYMDLPKLLILLLMTARPSEMPEIIYPDFFVISLA